MKTIVAGWFMIKGLLPGETNIYELAQPEQNYFITLTSRETLPYGPDHWIKLRMFAECEDSTDSDFFEGQSFIKNIHFCTADSFVELKCTERNSFVINGIKFC